MAHILAEPLISLGRTRARLIQRLTGELDAWPLLAGAWLFGSAARGTGDRESDVDLLLVPRKARRLPIGRTGRRSKRITC